MEQEILEIRTLGALEMTSSIQASQWDKKRSAQVTLLVIYLVMNRNRAVSVSQLIDFLWPQGDADKPEGALRNLVYRARKDLKELCPEQECITYKGRFYAWNVAIPCHVDYEDILKISHQVLQEQEEQQQLEGCLKLLTLLSGDFLPEFNYSDWIMSMNTMLKNACVNAILATCDRLFAKQRYQDVLRIVNHPHLQLLMDSRLFEKKLIALYKTNQIDQALSYYRQIVDYYYSRYGIEVSRHMKNIYQQILDTAPATQINVEELEHNLSEDHNEEKTFYCDFDVFKNIYQVNLRSARRSMKARVLALLTLEDSGQHLSQKAIQQEADILRDVIAASLRKNDVFSKFNMTQYSLIIASPDMEGATIAVERIVNRYQEKKKHTEMQLQHHLKKIN